MKKKFILLMMLLTIVGGVNFNVLNAQEQWYRIKALRYQGQGGWGSTTNYDFTTAMYLNIDNYDAHADGPVGGVSVASYSESFDQIFTLENNGDGTYYIKSASGKYIYCQSWNVDALDTKSPIGFEYVDANTFYMKNASQSKYFKVEYVSSAYYPFCDYANATYAATWVLEEASVAYTVNVSASSNEIWSDETVQLSATAINGAGNYTYSWSPATGLDNATSATPIFTPTAVGTYTFTCTATDANGDTATSEEITITVKDASERPKTRNIVFTLGDPGWGDGWNGNKLSISYEGFYEELTLTSGSTITYEREIPQGVEVTLTYKPDGEYEYENSFEIKYADGDVIWSKGENELSNTTISHIFIVESLDPTVEVSIGEENIASIAFGNVRLGEFWTEKEEISFNVRVEAKNGAEIGTITSTDDFFMFGTMYPAENSVDFIVRYDKNGSAGVHNGNMVITYTANEENLTKEIPMSATSYAPAKGDVIENSFEVSFDENSSYSYTITSLDGFYDDYVFSDNEQYDANCPDAVFAFTLDKEALVTIPNYDSDNSVSSWMSLYGNLTEDGPQFRVNYPEDRTRLTAGTYYVVVSPNSVPFNISITKEEVPAPIISYSNPSDGATNQDNPLLQWDIQYADEYQLLFGTEAENLDVVVDWTSELESEYQTAGLENVTKYYWQVNAKNEVGTTYGAVRSFVSKLPAPTNVKPENEDYIFVEGESNIVLTWDAIEGATYKVYKRNNQTYEYETLGTTENNTYVITSEYDMDGSYYAVSAVYEEIYESDKTLTDYRIYVTGYSSVKGVVTDGTNPIAGLTFEITGESALGEEIYIIETDENGAFNEPVLEGTYTLTISHYDYEEYVKDGIVCVYGYVNDRGEIALTAKLVSEGVVVTAEISTEDNANIIWTGEYTEYNVYRMNLDTYPQEAELIAENVTEKAYQDTDWATLDAGTYQYGVASITSTNNNSTEDFEDGNLPDGWISISSDGTSGGTYDWQVSGTYTASSTFLTATEVTSDGNYSVFSKSNGNADGTWYNKIYHYLVTPLLSQIPSTISFDYLLPTNYYSGSYTNTLKIKILTSSDSPQNWGNITAVATLDPTDSWTEKVIDLSEYTGQNVYIAFETQLNYGVTSGIDNISITSESVYEHAIVWSDEIENLGPNTFNATVDNAWNKDANWSRGYVPASGADAIVAANALISTDVNVNNLNIKAGSVTVDKNASLTVTGTIAQTTDYSLILNDGGQIFQDNADVTAVFNMNINKPTTWGTSQDGWQFISSPLAGVNVSNLAASEGDYDLFKYDGENKIWRNHKDENFAEDTYQHHIGYLVSHETESTIEFKGTLNVDEYFFAYITYYENEPLKNLHLIGNPFPFNMPWADFAYSKGIYDGYAVVNNNGGYDYLTGGTIATGDAFFVMAIGEEEYGTYYYYYPGSGSAKSRNQENNSINLIATSNAGKDNLIIKLAGKEENGFNKIENFNSEIAEIYVSNNGGRFAIRSYDADVQEIPVSFDAKQMGNYTIAAQPQGKFESVILVDRFTGVETNLLLEDYNFTSTGDENHDRFIVKLVNGQQTTDNSHFAYVLGEELILNVEGSVQIIDVMGRVIYANDVIGDNNRINVSNFDNAAYVIRVVNENGVKVQKIIL